MKQRRRPITVLVAALLGTAVTARLGVWQLDRADQKRALHDLIEQRALQPPLQTRDLASAPAEAAQQHYRLVRVQGRWLAERTVFLDNRQMRGHPGFFVVTPLLLDDGSAVLVQRGWVPRNAQDRARLPAVATPSGPVSVAGRVAPPPSRLFEFSSQASGPIRQNLDLAEFSRETGVALRPLSVQQSAGPAEADGLLRDWTLPPSDVPKHLGYAFQWFAMCALIAGLYVWFQILRPRLGARARADG